MFIGSVLQGCTAFSSPDAEFVALSEASKTILGFEGYLPSSGLSQPRLGMPRQQRKHRLGNGEC